MANIRITETRHKKFIVTVDEYPEITFTENSYKAARNKAVELVKEEIAKTIPQKAEEPEEARTTTRVKMGFAA